MANGNPGCVAVSIHSQKPLPWAKHATRALTIRALRRRSWRVHDRDADIGKGLAKRFVAPRAFFIEQAFLIQQALFIEQLDHVGKSLAERDKLGVCLFLRKGMGSRRSDSNSSNNPHVRDNFDCMLPPLIRRLYFRQPCCLASVLPSIRINAILAQANR